MKLIKISFFSFFLSIPEEKDYVDLDDQLPTHLTNSITTTTDLTCSNLSCQQQAHQLNSSSSDHQSDQTSRLGDELEFASNLSTAYILDHQPKLVSRSSSFYTQANHPQQQPDIQMNMIQSIQPLKSLIEHRPSIDTIDSYVESKFNFDSNQIEPKFIDTSLLDSSTLLSSFPFNSSRLSNSSFNSAQNSSYFEQFEPIGLLDQNVMLNSSNQVRCGGPTVVLIAHEDTNDQSICSTQQDINNLNFYPIQNYTNHLANNYHQETYPHSIHSSNNSDHHH